jgi:hypothetical protein
VRPGPDAWHQSEARDLHRAHPATDMPRADAFVALSEDQRRLIEVLQTQQRGMTERQLEVSLSWPRQGVQLLLQSLEEQRLVARLNTVIPSYIYRYGGVDLHGE